MRKSTAAQSLYRLIYCSQRVIPAAAPGPDDDLDSIVMASRRRNQAEGITSALLSTGTGFAHALEGPRDALDRVFERIAGDPRHTDVIVLSFTPTERRRFPDHALAAVAGLPGGMTDPIDGLKPDPSRDRPRVTTGSDILRLLETVVRASTELAV